MNAEAHIESDHTANLSAVHLIIDNDRGFLFERQEWINPSNKDSLTHWGLKKLEGKVLRGEALNEAVCRVAQLRLGINLNELVPIYRIDRKVGNTFTLEKIYYYVRSWDGELNKVCNPYTSVGELPESLQGSHDWIQPPYWSFYAMHPETKDALRELQKKFDTFM